MSAPKERSTRWKQARLDEACEVILGQSPPGNTYNFDGKGLPFFQGKAEFGDYYPTAVKWCSAPTKIAEAEDVLISVRAPVGPTNLCPSKACIGRGLAALRPKNGMPSRYVLYAVRATVEALIEQATGSTFEAVNGSDLRAHEISVAPPEEQRRIVAEIEKQFTRLEAGVSALRRVKDNLKRYRAAVLKAACEGRLVPTEAELAKPENRKFETGEELLAQILAQRREWFDRPQTNAKTKKKYIKPARPETANLPSLPDDWTWGTWNQVSNWVTYGFTRPMPHVGEGIPIITAKGVNKGRIDLKGAHLTKKEAYLKLSEKDRPQTGDILITKDGTIGRAAVVDTEREFCINQSVAVIWLRSCPMERKFLLTVIESELTQKPIWAKARGVAIQHLSITDFAKMALPIPPLAEQTRIVAEVERRLSVVEELEAVVSTSLQRATRLRQSVLQNAFAGALPR